MATSPKRLKCDGECSGNDGMFRVSETLNFFRFVAGGNLGCIVVDDELTLESVLLPFVIADDVDNVHVTENDVYFHMKQGSECTGAGVDFICVSLTKKQVWTYTEGKWNCQAHLQPIPRDFPFSEDTALPDFKSLFDGRKSANDVAKTWICCCLEHVFIFERDDNSTIVKVFKNPDQFLYDAVIDGNVTQVEAGMNHVVALCENDVFVHGTGLHGELGLGSSCLETRGCFTKLDFFEQLAPDKVVKIAVGGFYNMVLTKNGDVYCFGWNKNGVFGPGFPEDTVLIMNPHPVDVQKQVVDISAGFEMSLITFCEFVQAAYNVYQVF